MGIPRVAVLAPLPGDAVARLGARYDVRVHPGPALTAPAAVAEAIGDADGAISLLSHPVDREVLSRCRHLRVVANCAVGYDNVDLAAAEARGVWVTNTPDVLTEATADLVWALVLAVTRRVVEGDRLVRQGRFDGWALDLLLGPGLQGQTLGLIGFGRIGRAVARRGRAFGMDLVFHDPGVRDPVDGARPVPLDDLLAASRVVSLHCPLTPETRHLLDEDHLRRMAPDAVLINTARGPVVDEAALVRVLEDGHLRGAGLDVYEAEPEVHPGLLGRDDVVLLPHVGSATVETRQAMADLAADNLIAVLEGREPPTPVVRGR
jgi:glyoxylate reductase